LSVVVKNWGSLAVISWHSLFKDLSIVILSLDQWLSSDIINIINLGRVELNMIWSSTWWMDSSSFDSLNKNIIINLELKNSIDFLLFLAKHAIKLFSLNVGSWETIKKNTSFTLWLLHGIID
jgi:hypothetical protein